MDDRIVDRKEAEGMGTPEELAQLVDILVRRIRVWRRPALGDGEMRRVGDGADVRALARDERPGDDCLMEAHLTAEEHDVWLRAVRRYRRDIGPGLTETQCFELVMKEFLRLHEKGPCSCA